MERSHSTGSIPIPGWIKTELNTGIDRKIRAKEIGKHQKRVLEQKADVDNRTPKNVTYYKKLRYHLFDIEKKRIKKKIDNSNIELLKNLITLSQDETNYKSYPKSPHLKFSQRMSKLTRSRRHKQINQENIKLKQRLSNVKPSRSLKAMNMAKDYKMHKKLQQQFVIINSQKRNQPDVIQYKRQKLTKKERTHFMQPLNRPIDLSENIKKIIKRQRPMTPNTYKYNKMKNQNKQHKTKNKRPQSSRNPISSKCLKKNQTVASNIIFDARIPKSTRSCGTTKYKKKQNHLKSKTRVFKSKNVNQSTTNWHRILTDDMEDFGISTSPNGIKSLSKGISPPKFGLSSTSPKLHSPSYILRATKIYGTQNMLFPSKKQCRNIKTKNNSNKQ